MRMAKPKSKSIIIVVVVLVVALVGGVFAYRKFRGSDANCAEKEKEIYRNYFIAKGDTQGEPTSKYANLHCPELEGKTLAPAPAN